MLETLFGGLLGGAFRLAPEVLKWFDRDAERKHELALLDMQIEHEKVLKDSRVAIEQERSYTAGIEALKDAVAGQSEKSGVGWVDAISSLVRPVVTFWFMGIYCAVKSVGIYMTYQTTGDFSTAINTAWSDSDMALFAGIINFWFLGRVFDRGNK